MSSSSWEENLAKSERRRENDRNPAPDVNEQVNKLPYNLQTWEFTVLTSQNPENPYHGSQSSLQAPFPLLYHYQPFQHLPHA